MRTFGTLAEAQADINKEKNDNNIVGEVAVRVAYKQGADAAAVQVSQSDHALTPTVDIRGTKRWVDNEDQRGKPHPAITVRLLRNGVEVASYAYAVEEATVPAGYTSSISPDSTQIVNTLDPARGNTTDGDSKAPDKKAGNPVAPKPLAKTGDCTPLLPAIVLLAGAGIAAFALKRTAARP